MALAVVTVASGGLPVVDVTATAPKTGLAVTEAARGLAVTKVAAGKAGMAMTYVPVETAGGVASDPSYSSVVFLWEAEGINNQQNSPPLVDAKNGRAITCSGTAKISNVQARVGSTSLFVGTGGASAAPNADWQLGNTTNASPFTIEFSILQDTWNQWDGVVQVWDGAQKAWWIRLQTDGQIRFLGSSDGATSTLDVTTTGFGLGAVGVWHDIMIDKDATGKLRFYRGGVMKYSITPADSKFFLSTNSSLIFNINGANNGYIDHIRLSRSTRCGNDAGYTFSATPFPTS